jgi:hypothetical protein
LLVRADGYDVTKHGDRGNRNACGQSSGVFPDFLRFAAAALAAAAFVFLCWLMNDNVNSLPRILSGPTSQFRTYQFEDQAIGVVVTAILLPCIFAVVIWRNKGTVALAVLALLFWFCFSFSFLNEVLEACW